MFALGIILLVSPVLGMYCPNSDHSNDFVYRVTKNTCGCNSESAGTLRYHNQQIQFCNGEDFVTLSVVGRNIPAKLGSKENPGTSCVQILSADSSAKSGMYFIKRGEEVTNTYCYMDEICGSRGWTMIMKIDGGKKTFNYDSSKWTDKHPYNEAAASGGLDDKETKLNTYFDFPFNKLCLGMKTNSITKWIPLYHQASSLYSVIHDNRYTSTHLGRDAWKSLIPGSSSLQKNCNQEGFNTRFGNAAMARIGIIGNQEKNCKSPDSRLGFGTSGSNCGQDKENSAGNEARCSPDNRDRSIKSIGYIFAQGRVEGAPLGTYDNPASSCRTVKDKRRDARNGVYYLSLGGKTVKTFCVMDEICGQSGWAMIMKIDGKKTTFGYNAAYWKNKGTYNIFAADGGLDDKETKLETYSSLPFNALCLGMKTGSTTRWLKLPQKASSLYSLISDDRYRATNLGRNAWKSLIPGSSSLQKNCNREGFNLKVGNGAMARIGIIGNQENNCNSPDSRLGFGTSGSNCGQDNNNSAGNEARCSPDNSNRSIKSIGYILAQ